MAIVDVIMPQLGESIAEGTISKWHKKKGEAIGRDEPLLEISTDKVDSEIPSPAAGVIADVLYPEQTTVSVMTVIARIDTEPSSSAGRERAQQAETADIPQASITAQVQNAFSPAEAPQSAPPVSAASAQSSSQPSPPAPSAQAPPTSAHEGRFYSPLVLNIARREGISMQELERIEGTGASGRVSKNDVLAWLGRRKQGGAPEAKPEMAAAPQPVLQTAPEQNMPRIEVIEPARAASAVSGEREERIPMDAMRRSIAANMVRSKQTSPHVYTVTEADVSKLAAYRERVKDEFERREGVKLTLTPFFLDAAAKALREFPYLNASVEGETVVLKKDIHLGVAVALENNGLIVPVIRHADEKNIAGLARAVADLSARARAKRLLPDDVQGGTFTVTNPGMIGNLYGIPIINQPQVAILAVGAVKKRPVVVDDAIAIRSMAYLSLSYDHRIIDGQMGGRFLERIVSLLENFNTQLSV